MRPRQRIWEVEIKGKMTKTKLKSLCMKFHEFQTLESRHSLSRHMHLCISKLTFRPHVTQKHRIILNTLAQNRTTDRPVWYDKYTQKKDSFLFSLLSPFLQHLPKTHKLFCCTTDSWKQQSYFSFLSFSTQNSKSPFEKKALKISLFSKTFVEF